MAATMVMVVAVVAVVPAVLAVGTESQQHRMVVVVDLVEI